MTTRKIALGRRQIEAIEALWDAIAESGRGAVTTADVRVHTGWAQKWETTIRDRLYGLVDKGMVAHKWDGPRHQWSLTDAGRDYLSRRHAAR